LTALLVRLVDEVDAEHHKVAGDQLRAGEDDHHETEGDAEAADHEQVLTLGAAPSPAHLTKESETASTRQIENK